MNDDRVIQPSLKDESLIADEKQNNTFQPVSQITSSGRLATCVKIEEQYWLYRTAAIVLTGIFLVLLYSINQTLLPITLSTPVAAGLFLVFTIVACGGIISGVLSLWYRRLKQARNALRQETYEQNREFFDALEENIYRSLRRGM